VNTFIEPAPGVVGPVDGRALRKAETRARILEVARAELESVGYEAANIRAIAKTARVAPGTVLLHFRDKQELLHAALFDDLERTWTAARKRARRRSLEEDLVALARAFFRYYAARPALSRALLRESLFAAPPWTERFARQTAEVHAHVATLATEAKARGEMSIDADVAVFGTAFLSFYYFALLAWAQGGHPDPARLMRRMLAQHLDGVKPRSRTAKGRAR
jgi:AcrR family transcriptional regulator